MVAADRAVAADGELLPAEWFRRVRRDERGGLRGERREDAEWEPARPCRGRRTIDENASGAIGWRRCVDDLSVHRPDTGSVREPGESRIDGTGRRLLPPVGGAGRRPCLGIRVVPRGCERLGSTHEHRTRGVAGHGCEGGWRCFVRPGILRPGIRRHQARRLLDGARVRRRRGRSRRDAIEQAGQCGPGPLEKRRRQGPRRRRSPWGCRCVGTPPRGGSRSRGRRSRRSRSGRAGPRLAERHRDDLTSGFHAGGPARQERKPATANDADRFLTGLGPRD